jgi:hypothetical protein
MYFSQAQDHECPQGSALVRKTVTDEKESAYLQRQMGQPVSVALGSIAEGAPLLPGA